MAKNQRWAIIAVALMALLALPTYVIVGILTLPLGIGLLMLANSSPWILNFYPLLFAGEGHWRAPLYYLDIGISLPLTLIQWILIAWLSSIVLRKFKPSTILLGALALMIMIGALTSVILSVMGITLLWEPAHM
jgi:hypothetical protein